LIPGRGHVQILNTRQFLSIAMRSRVERSHYAAGHPGQGFTRESRQGNFRVFCLSRTAAGQEGDGFGRGDGGETAGDDGGEANSRGVTWSLTQDDQRLQAVFPPYVLFQHYRRVEEEYQPTAPGVQPSLPFC